MEFIMLTLSIALGVVIAMVILAILALNPITMKLYTKLVIKNMNNTMDYMINDKDL